VLRLNRQPKVNTMTDDTMPLLELLQKRGGGDFLKELSEAVLQRLMEFEVEGVVGAGRHERSEDRTTHRNGFRDRTLETRLGTLELRSERGGVEYLNRAA
jgi:putative transposase